MPPNTEESASRLIRGQVTIWQPLSRQPAGNALLKPHPWNAPHRGCGTRLNLEEKREQRETRREEKRREFFGRFYKRQILTVLTPQKGNTDVWNLDFVFRQLLIWGTESLACFKQDKRLVRCCEMMQYYLTVIFIALWVTKLYKRRQKASFQQSWRSGIWHFLCFIYLSTLGS